MYWRESVIYEPPYHISENTGNQDEVLKLFRLNGSILLGLDMSEVIETWTWLI